MLNRPIHYSQPVIVLLNVGVSAKVMFEEQPRLEGAYILGIEAYSGDQQFYDEQGRPVVTSGNSVYPLVTFKTGSVERIEDVPYRTFIAMNNAGAVNQYAGFNINWPKSYVTIPPGVVFDELPCVLVFMVHYIPIANLGQFTAQELRSFMF